MRFCSLNTCRRSVAAILTATILLTPGSAAARPAGNHRDVKSLVARLFLLVEQTHSRIGEQFSALEGTRRGPRQQAIEKDLVRDVALFQERNVTLMEKLLQIRKVHPSMIDELSEYSRSIHRLEQEVRDRANRHGLEARISNARPAIPPRSAGSVMHNRHGLESALGAPAWETGRHGAPPNGKTRYVARPEPRFQQAQAQAKPRRPRSREDLKSLVDKIRQSHADHQATVDISVDNPEDPNVKALKDELAASPSMPGAARGKRTVPILLEVRDSSGRPVSRRRVEFIIQQDDSNPVAAELLDGSSRVRGNTLIELTDSTGVARVDMRIDGQSGPVRIQREVIPRPDRTICRMKVIPRG